MRRGAAWCGMVWYSVVWCGMVWYGVWEVELDRQHKLGGELRCNKAARLLSRSGKVGRLRQRLMTAALPTMATATATRMTTMVKMRLLVMLMVTVSRQKSGLQSQQSQNRVKIESKSSVGSKSRACRITQLILAWRWRSKPAHIIQYSTVLCSTLADRVQKGSFTSRIP